MIFLSRSNRFMLIRMKCNPCLRFYFWQGGIIRFCVLKIEYRALQSPYRTFLKDRTIRYTPLLETTFWLRPDGRIKGCRCYIAPLFKFSICKFELIPCLVVSGFPFVRFLNSFYVSADFPIFDEIVYLNNIRLSPSRTAYNPISF